MHLNTGEYYYSTYGTDRLARAITKASEVLYDTPLYQARRISLQCRALCGERRLYPILDRCYSSMAANESAFYGIREMELRAARALSAR